MSSTGPHVLLVGGKSSDDATRLSASLAQVDAEGFGVQFTPAAAPETTVVPRFDVNAFFSALTTERIGRCLLAGREIGSTQVFVSENAATLPNGTVCVADVQTTGKGRGSNTWTSPEGCLMFSFTTRVKDGRTLPLLQYVVTLAFVEAVQEQATRALGAAAADKAAAALAEATGRAPRAGQPPAVVDVRIKWPNDVYSGGKKIGGVLCQSVYAEGEYAVTVGIGLNVSNSQPSTCVNDIVAAAAAAAAQPAPQRVSSEALLASFLGRYEALEATFVSSGFAPLQSAYLHHWLHSRQPVTLLEGDPPAQQEIRLTVAGLTSSGYLLAVDGFGEEYELHPDGNSLDFFQGLIRRKIGAKV